METLGNMILQAYQLKNYAQAQKNHKGFEMYHKQQLLLIKLMESCEEEEQENAIKREESKED